MSSSQHGATEKRPKTECDMKRMAASCEIIQGERWLSEGLPEKIISL